jgi:hypothetical protein
VNQSEAVYQAVYDSDWYNQSGRYKFLTRMLIMRSQRPVRLTAGRFGTLSLPLFASVSALLATVHAAAVHCGALVKCRVQEPTDVR